MTQLNLAQSNTVIDTFEVAFNNWKATLGTAGVAPFQAMMQVLPTAPSRACDAVENILAQLITVGSTDVHISQLASAVEAVCSPENVDALRQSATCYVRVAQALILVAHHFTDVDALAGSATPFYISILQENKMLSTVQKLLTDNPELDRGQWYDYIAGKLAGPVWRRIEDLYDVRHLDTPDVAAVMTMAYPAMLAEHLGCTEKTQVVLPSTMTNDNT